MSLPIVERLRRRAGARSTGTMWRYKPREFVEWEAADTIEELVEALRPFSNLLGGRDAMTHGQHLWVSVRVGDVRNARALLAKINGAA